MTRTEIQQIIETIRPFDEQEAVVLQESIEWVKSDAPLYRLQKPAVPPKHLVSYFAIFDSETNKMLLQDHLLAKKWLPAGGHVDPDENPAETVRRECQEELGIKAVFLGEPIPHFITATVTNGQGEHTDVSLWYVLQAKESTPLTIEPDRFADVRWWHIDDVLATPIDQFDQEIHRFITKIKQENLLKLA
jgi:8-oxo-dGTP pyrophosphatase MutT (NUDIX family)